MWEWIRSTSVAGISRTSNNNGGYADFTSSPAIPLVRGAPVPVSFQPGFASSTYTEHWKVWIDLNQNSLFDSNEALWLASGTSTVNGQFVVPSTALTGATRMRVQMKYGGTPGACDQFAYGEVEDYLVTIAP